MACYRMRDEAFREIFAPSLGEAATAAGIRAYPPETFARMLSSMRSFMAEQKDSPVGFSAVKLINPMTAELSYLYVRRGLEGRGIGKQLLTFSENWLIRHHPEVRSLVLDTIVPAYNGPFYSKMGFVIDGERMLPYPDMPVKTMLMRKDLAAAG